MATVEKPNGKEEEKAPTYSGAPIEGILSTGEWLEQHNDLIVPDPQTKQGEPSDEKT